MFQSATIKLTAWYLALVMAVSLVFSGVVYRVGTNEITRTLHRQNQRIYSDFPIFNRSPFLNDEADLQSGERRLLGQLALFNIVVFVGAGLASYYLARRTLKPIEEAHARQKRFTADVSHELRTPITALKMGSEVALMDKTASKNDLRNALESNIEEANKLDKLINSLLRLSRLDADELRLGFTLLETNNIAEEALEKLRQAADEKYIKVNVSTEGGTVHGDRESLVQLISILLDNAIKYSPKGSEIWLSTKILGSHSVIEIRDKGIGIEPAALQHVFDRFYRADSSRQHTNSGGFGLGLSIAEKIAELHNANITIKSAKNKGTTAIVAIPTNN